MWKNKNNIGLFAKEYFNELVEAFNLIPENGFDEIVNMLQSVYKSGKHVFLIGNGGSAATASHFANDLSKGTMCDGKKRFKAFSLTDNIPLVTAWANDANFEKIFVEQLYNLFQKGDIVIAITGSGNSPNILKAVEFANSKGGTTFGFIGFEGGKLKDIVQKSIIEESNKQEIIEDIHLILEHIICKYLKFRLEESS